MDVFRTDDRYIYLNIPYCEFYIPLDYFDSKWATKLSDTIRTLGLFNVGIFEKGELKDIKLLNLPTMIELFTYETENRSITFKNSENVNCMVLKYFKDQKIMESSTIEDSQNAEKYLDIIIKGKVPSTIPYSKSLPIWMKNQRLNNVNFGVPSAVLEMILAVCYRDKNHMEKKFSTVIGKDPNVSEYDYKMAKIREICQYASTFSAMTFEDINSMITTSVNRTRENKEEMVSPVEKIIKY